MMVNNETGAINDPEAIGIIVREAGGKVKYHVDAVQGYMKYPIDVRKMNIDFLSVSAHKVHGPKGVGFVYMKKGQRPISFFLGGAQERGLRAGTVNVPSILGFSEIPALLEGQMDENFERVSLLKKTLIEELTSIKELKINSKLDCTSPYILNISLPGLRGEVMLHYLSDKGVYVSTGSACSSKDTKDSHVLQAIGVKEKEIKGSLRLSFSEENTLEEITYAAGVIKEAVNFLRRK
jgi:cysteine desulfurase